MTVIPEQSRKKSQARQWARSELAKMTLAARAAASRRIVQHIFNHCQQQRDLGSGFKRLFLFAGKLTEPMILDVVSQVARLNIKCFLPVVLDAEHMEFSSYPCKEPLQTNRYGIAEPSLSKAAEPPETDDLVLVPCLAAGWNGARLGHGRGYYDRYLQRCDARPYGVLFACQMSDMPLWQPESHDVSLSGIFTEEGLTLTRVV